MIIEYSVVGQILQKVSGACLANDTQNYLSLSFTFNEEWDNYTSKYCIFTYKGKHYQTTLTYDEAVGAYVQIVPKEVLKGKGFFISLYGVVDNERITTNQVRIDLLESGYTTDISSIDYPTVPDVFTELYGRLSDLDSEMQLKMELRDVEYEIKKAYWKLENDIRTGGN